MYRLNISTSFEAAHQLHGMPEGHKCGRLHGHSYNVRVSLDSPNLNATGMIVDAGIMKEFIRKALDHQNLNEILGALNPTAENLSRWIAVQMKNRIQLGIEAGVVAKDTTLGGIVLQETESTAVEYIPDMEPDVDIKEKFAEFKDKLETLINAKPEQSK